MPDESTSPQSPHASVLLLADRCQNPIAGINDRYACALTLRFLTPDKNSPSGSCFRSSRPSVLHFGQAPRWVSWDPQSAFLRRHLEHRAEVVSAAAKGGAVEIPRIVKDQAAPRK